MISATETNIIIIQKMSKLNRGTVDQSQNGLPIQINETIVNRVNSGHLLFKLKHVLSKWIFAIVYFTRGKKINISQGFQDIPSCIPTWRFTRRCLDRFTSEFSYLLNFAFCCQKFTMLQTGWKVGPLWLNHPTKEDTLTSTAIKLTLRYIIWNM